MQYNRSVVQIMDYVVKGFQRQADNVVFYIAYLNLVDKDRELLEPENKFDVMGNLTQKGMRKVRKIWLPSSLRRLLDNKYRSITLCYLHKWTVVQQ